MNNGNEFNKLPSVNPDNSPRVAFCSLLANGAAALVTKGVDLQGFVHEK